MDNILDELKLALTSRGIVLPTDETLNQEIDLATLAINERRKVAYDTAVQARYKGILIELCVEAISKYGAEGETSHGENGISRNYDNASPYSEATLSKIIPRIGVG